MSPVSRNLAVVTTFTAALSLGVPAMAGTLQLRDAADLLTPADEAALREGASRYAFDVRVLTDTRFASRADFERHVAAQLASPEMVVIGIDPTHRWTAVHFGTATRVATNQYSAVENAGDPYFRGGQWRGGVEAILGAAQSSVGAGAASPASRASGAPGFPWGIVMFGVLAIGGIALASRFLRRRAQSQVGGYGDGAYAQRGPYGTPAYPPGYGPANYNAGYGPGGYGPGGGYGPYGGVPGSSVGTGLAGAALGGLAGYALGNAMANRDDHNVGHADTMGAGNDAGSWDAGGSSSGWDEGGGGGGGDFGGGDGGGGDW